MMRILITDDHPIVRMGFRKILEQQPGEASVDEVGTGPEAIEKVKSGAYDAVLLDISMPGMGGLEVLGRMKALRPALPVLVVSMHDEEVYAVRALKSGASGYITKKSAPNELLEAIRKIQGGSRYVSASLADLLLSETEEPLHQSLSDREFLVMKMICAGKPLKEIAMKMSISPKTISTYRSRLLRKLRLKSTAEVVEYCLRNNLAD